MTKKLLAVSVACFFFIFSTAQETAEEWWEYAQSISATDPDSALTTYQYVFDRFGTENDTIKIKCLYSMGIVLDQQSKFPEAITYLDSALTLAQLGSYEDQVNRATNSLGVVALRKGDYEKALEYFVRTIQNSSLEEDYQVKISATQNAGHVLYYQGDLPGALHFYLQCEEMAKEMADVGQLGRAYSNQALIYQTQSNFDEALTTYDKAGQLLRDSEMEMSLDMANVIQNKAICMKQKGDLERASALYEESKDIFAQMGNSEGLAQTEVNQSLMWLDSGNPRRAVTGLKRALNLCEDIGSLEGVKYANQGLSNAYSALNMTDSALFFYRAFHSVEDSLEKALMSERLDDLRVKYETSEKERTIALLEKQKQVDDTSIFRLQVILIASFITAILFAVVFIIWRRNVDLRKKRQQLLQFNLKTLEWQEQERKRIASELHDGIGQSLIMAKNNLQRFDPDTPEESNALVERVEATVTDTIQEVRSISYSLRPFYLDLMGLEGALYELTAELGRTTTIEVESSISEVEGFFMKDQEIHLFRIFQEIIQNIVKHARASEVNFVVKGSDNKLHVEIKDNGKGFDVASSFNAGTGLGLRGLKERCNLLNGVLQIYSESGKGTTTKITFVK